MKKITALLLALSLALGVMIPAFAGGNTDSSAFADGENSLIVFVTGIGQSWSYFFDESYTRPGAFADGDLHDYDNYAPLIADGKYKSRWNLFNNDFDEALSDTDTLGAIVSTVVRLLMSQFLRKDITREKDITEIITSLFRYNLIDENGKSDPRLVTPRYVMPVSEYPYSSDGSRSEAKERFYSSIPCKEICEEYLGEGFEDYLYCYNYCAFSFTDDNVAGLHDFVETVLADNKVDANEVILVPMSMGATVVSAYLAKYPDRADNHVRRVVSIVGAWNGSDVVADLLKQSYADNSPELFYNGLIAQMIGEPWGYLVNTVLRIFPKASLRSFIDKALSVLGKELFGRTPSLMNVIPYDDYDELSYIMTDENVKRQVDEYHAAQGSLKERFEALEAQGVTFSFISGYGLPFGAVTSDYTAFGFMNHAPITNSDEIINIDSTAPGTQYVPYDQAFADTEGRVLSPDGSIDISGTYYKDSSWFFCGQKHELEYNNTAIALAIGLALGNIKTVADCDDPDEDGYYYPQFNGARNVKKLKGDYLPAYEKYLKNGGTVTADQAALYDKTVAMMNCTVNDYEADNALIEEFRLMLIDLGVYEPDPKPDTFGEGITKLFKASNDLTFKIFGAKGFLDWLLPAC